MTSFREGRGRARTDIGEPAVRDPEDRMEKETGLEMKNGTVVAAPPRLHVFCENLFHVDGFAVGIKRALDSNLLAFILL
jgi:hypothetical protein